MLRGDRRRRLAGSSPTSSGRTRGASTRSGRCGCGWPTRSGWCRSPGRSPATRTLTVTPRIVPLSRPPLAGNWLGDSEHGQADHRRQRRRRRGAARLPHRGQPAPGALAVHRAVRRADGAPRGAALAEHGLALPRHQARPRTPTAMFELAVTAAASIGVHLAGEGFEARFVTDAGRGAAAGHVPRHAARHARRHRGRPSSIGLEPGHPGARVPGAGRSSRCRAADGRGRHGSSRGPARHRAGRRPAAGARRPGRAARTAATAQVLTGAGWRVAAVPDAARLAAAWQELHQAGGAAMACAGGLTEAGAARRTRADVATTPPSNGGRRGGGRWLATAGRSPRPSRRSWRPSRCTPSSSGLPGSGPARARSIAVARRGHAHQAAAAAGARLPGRRRSPRCCST